MHSPGRHKVKRGSTQAAFPDPPARTTPRTTRPRLSATDGPGDRQSGPPAPAPGPARSAVPAAPVCETSESPGPEPCYGYPGKPPPGSRYLQRTRNQRPPSRASRDGTKSRRPQESTDPPHRGALRAQHTDPHHYLLKGFWELESSRQRRRPPSAPGGLQSPECPARTPRARVGRGVSRAGGVGLLLPPRALAMRRAQFREPRGDRFFGGSPKGLR